MIDDNDGAPPPRVPIWVWSPVAMVVAVAIGGMVLFGLADWWLVVVGIALLALGLAVSRRWITLEGAASVVTLILTVVGTVVGVVSAVVSRP